MIILKATVEDARLIAQNNMCLAKESEGERLDYDTALYGANELLKDEQKGFYLVAKVKIEIIGQLMITYEWSDWRNQNIWWVQSVYVSKDHRQKGVFASLLQEVKKRALKQKVSLLRLYVHKNNNQAITVYEHSNWQKKSYQYYSLQVRSRSPQHLYPS